MKRCILPKGSSDARWRQACARFYATKDSEGVVERPRGRPRKVAEGQLGTGIDGRKTARLTEALPAANGVNKLSGNMELEKPVRKPQGRPRKVVDGQLGTGNKSVKVTDMEGFLPAFDGVYALLQQQEPAPKPRGRPGKVIEKDQKDSGIEEKRSIVFKKAPPILFGVDMPKAVTRQNLAADGVPQPPVQEPGARSRGEVERIWGLDLGKKESGVVDEAVPDFSGLSKVTNSTPDSSTITETASSHLETDDMDITDKAGFSSSKNPADRSSDTMSTIFSTCTTISLEKRDFPLSPLMDSTFLAAREKHKLPKGPPTQGDPGSFQARLAKNPYALALATPVRQCNITGTLLPKFFLQDYNMMAHPETGETWYVPSSLAKHGVSEAEKRSRKRVSEVKSSKAVDCESIEEENTTKDGALAINQGKGKKIGQNVYTLNSRLILDEMQKSRFNVQKLIPQRIRHINVATRTASNARWRTDMRSFVTELWRRRIAEDLAHVKGLRKGYYLVKCKDLEDARESRQVGAFLWIGGGDGDGGIGDGGEAPGQWATVDVQSGHKATGRTRKVPIYNLREMLGDKALGKMMERQNGKSAVLGGQIVAMKDKKVTLELRMKLWKFRGFMAVPEPETELVYDVDDEEEDWDDEDEDEEEHVRYDELDDEGVELDIPRPPQTIRSIKSPETADSQWSGPPQQINPLEICP